MGRVTLKGEIPFILSCGAYRYSLFMLYFCVFQYNLNVGLDFCIKFLMNSNLWLWRYIIFWILLERLFLYQSTPKLSLQIMNRSGKIRVNLIRKISVAQYGCIWSAVSFVYLILKFHLCGREINLHAINRVINTHLCMQFKIARLRFL